MIVIIADTVVDTDLDVEVNKLADEFGLARTQTEKEQIAEKIYFLIGTNLKSMLSNASKGFRLPTAELESLAWQGLTTALSNSGMSRLKRSDGIWETLIQRCLQSNQPAAKRIWDGLSPDLRKTLENTIYLKSTIADKLVAELNALLRRTDLYNANAWAGVTLLSEARVLLEKGIPKLSAVELTRLNLLLLASAFPEIKAPAAPPVRNLIGYFAKFFMPKAKAEMAEMTGAHPEERLLQLNSIVNDTQIDRALGLDLSTDGGEWTEEWRTLLRRMYRTGHSGILDAVLASAWGRQTGGGRSKVQHRNSPPPVATPWKDRKWWRKERLDQAVLQVATRCSKDFFGGDTTTFVP